MSIVWAPGSPFRVAARQAIVTRPAAISTTSGPAPRMLATAEPAPIRPSAHDRRIALGSSVAIAWPTTAMTTGFTPRSANASSGREPQCKYAHASSPVTKAAGRMKDNPATMRPSHPALS